MRLYLMSDDGEWLPQQVELVKKDEEWYACFTVGKPSKGFEPQTPIDVDIGKRNLATAVALVNDKATKGHFLQRL